MASRLAPERNKFHAGASADGKHYWLTPPDVYAALDAQYEFDFDPCPFPKPDDFDGLTCEWGKSNYVNPPFGSILHDGKRKGMTAWVRKALAEQAKGKRVVMVYPLDKWVLMLLAAGAKVSNLGDVRWHATEDNQPGKGTGRHIAAFVLEPKDIGESPAPPSAESADTERLDWLESQPSLSLKWYDEDDGFNHSIVQGSHGEDVIERESVRDWIDAARKSLPSDATTAPLSETHREA